MLRRDEPGGIWTKEETVLAGLARDLDGCRIRGSGVSGRVAVGRFSGSGAGSTGVCWLKLWTWSSWSRGKRSSSDGDSEMKSIPQTGEWMENVDDVEN